MGGRNILLVEDDSMVRDIIKFALEKKNHYVLEAATYSGAIEKIKNPIDIAIIDYILPDNNGLEIVKKIREVKPLLPVIIMTAYSTETLVINALRKGVTEYIKKPLSLSYLIGKVSEMLGEEKETVVSEYVNSRDEFIIDGIAAYMEERYRENLSLKKLTAVAGMNKDKFYKVFKERFGETSVSYLNNIRVRNAAELLRNSDLSITEIAISVGYKSVDHFERVFRSKFNLTPRDYRKKY